MEPSRKLQELRDRIMSDPERRERISRLKKNVDVESIKVADEPWRDYGDENDARRD